MKLLAAASPQGRERNGFHNINGFLCKKKAYREENPESQELERPWVIMTLSETLIPTVTQAYPWTVP